MKDCNPGCNYRISQDMSERINIFRLIMTILVIFNHSNSNLSLFSGEALTVSVSHWVSESKYIIAHFFGRATVPGFFMVSAILLYRKPFNWASNMKRKLRSIAVPYFIINCGWILLFFIVQLFPFSSSIFNNPDNIIANWDLRQWCNALLGAPDKVVPFVYPLWFLRDLFIMNLLAGIIWKLVDKLPEPTFIAAIIAWLWFAQSNSSVPDFQSVCFWIFGTYIVKRNINPAKLDKIPTVLIAAILALCIYAEKLHRYDINYLVLYNLSITLSLLLVFRICTYIKCGKFKSALLWLSGYSFSIYLFHEFTTLTFRKIVASLLPASNVSYFLQFMLTPFIVAGFCLILSLLLQKLFPRFYALLSGGRAK